MNFLKLLGYTVKDYPTYKIIKPTFETTWDLTILYSVNGGEWITTNLDSICVNSNATSVELCGYTFQDGYSGTIKIELTANRVSELVKIPKFVKTVNRYIPTNQFVQDAYYTVDLYDDGNSYPTLPSRTYKIVGDIKLYNIYDDEVDRIDYISSRLYGTGRYWYILSHYNLLMDPFKFRNNNIVAPTIAQLYSDGGLLRMPTNWLVYY